MTHFSSSTLALLPICLLAAACDTPSGESGRPAVDLADLDAVLARGRELYFGSGACADCHGDLAEGIDAPSLTFGPTAYDIYYQLNTNPEMGETRANMQASNDELVTLAAYVLDLTGTEVTVGMLADQVASVAGAREFSEYAPENIFASEHDRQVVSVQRHDSMIQDWERRSQTGNIMHSYQVQVATTWEAGEPKFTPEPGKVYFYENTGANRPVGYQQAGQPSVSIVVGDAASKEVIASYQFPPELRTSMHTTAVTPDGKYVYVPGSRPVTPGAATRTVSGARLRYALPGLDSSATIIKADALTLQPVAQLIVGGRMHHAQIFQNRYMLVDTFGREDDGLDVFLIDPETDEIIGGVRDEELGGSSYTAFTDNEFIYILMEPTGYGTSTTTGYLAALQYNQGEYAVLRSFWVAKLDPETWEVVQEYPYRGFRSSWLTIDSQKRYMYVPASASNYLNKIDLTTGTPIWTTPTGTGPYGATLNADETEIWVADKGETTGMFGRTITVIDTNSGRPIETVFAGYQIDHVLLSPNGREMWGTSNRDGKIYVFDAARREMTHEIDMPNFGDAHGLVFVWYDDAGVPHVVRDQGGFQGGINPALGRPLDY